MTECGEIRDQKDAEIADLKAEIERLYMELRRQADEAVLHHARAEKAETRLKVLEAELKRQEANAVYSEGQRKGWQKNAARLRDKLEAAQARIKNLEPVVEAAKVHIEWNCNDGSNPLECTSGCAASNDDCRLGPICKAVRALEEV